jgi:hypothetical protein
MAHNFHFLLSRFEFVAMKLVLSSLFLFLLAASVDANHDEPRQVRGVEGKYRALQNTKVLGGRAKGLAANDIVGSWNVVADILIPESAKSESATFIAPSNTYFKIEATDLPNVYMWMECINPGTTFKKSIPGTLVVTNAARDKVEFHVNAIRPEITVNSVFGGFVLDGSFDQNNNMKVVLKGLFDGVTGIFNGNKVDVVLGPDACPV